MLEAGAGRRDMAGHQRMVSAIVGQAFERGHAMLGGHHPDRFHLGANVDRLQPRYPFLDLGNPVADAVADNVERIERGHG